MELSEKLKLIRKAENKTQKEIAELIEIDETNYQRYEYGKVSPNIKIIQKLCQQFPKYTLWLLKDDEDTNTPQINLSTNNKMRDVNNSGNIVIGNNNSAIINNVNENEIISKDLQNNIQEILHDIYLEKIKIKEYKEEVKENIKELTKKNISSRLNKFANVTNYKKLTNNQYQEVNKYLSNWLNSYKTVTKERSEWWDKIIPLRKKLTDDEYFNILNNQYYTETLRDLTIKELQELYYKLMPDF